MFEFGFIFRLWTPQTHFNIHLHLGQGTADVLWSIKGIQFGERHCIWPQQRIRLCGVHRHYHD